MPGDWPAWVGLTTSTLRLVKNESERAVAKHGLENTPLAMGLDDLSKLPILGEEYGEVCRALTYDEGQGLAHLRDELVQVASVAACWAQAITERLETSAADVVVSET